MSLFTSPIAISAFGAMLLAQVLKVPIDRIRRKEWNWSLLINSGGMPSSHSALMAAVTTSIGLYHGWGSPIFILGLAITVIVVYDATGVRRQAGLHAERINQIARQFLEHRNVPSEQAQFLREVIGHSPLEAAIGTLLGIVFAVVIWLLMPA